MKGGDMTTPERQQEPIAELDGQEPSLAIWIGSQADYQGERQHGGWVDARQPTRQVLHDIRDIIDRTPNGLQQQWGIHELRGFGAWHPVESDGLPIVLQVARGIQCFGAPYSGLVAAVGADARAAELHRFPQSYLGDWPSLLAFVEQVATDSGWHQHLARLPASMRDFVRLDYRKLAREAKHELTIVDHPDGIWVYDPRRW
jgi:hypothetical protein